MKLCSSNCIPCCDYCKYVEHYEEEINGMSVKMATKGCTFHLDEEHQEIAKHTYFCDDFYCGACKE